MPSFEPMKELVLHNCRLDKRYDIREQLGRGSYAQIYLACDTLASPQSPHNKVVIKALNVFLQDDLDAELERTLVENFQNEAIALDRVRHPNIISRLGHGTARDLEGTVFHYLVIEYLAGGDIQGLLRRRDLSPEKALDHIEQICAGLAHAHSCGIIHRDIKPHNLLLTADLTTVKIADFGVARLSAVDSPITRVGTNIYAPPEHSPMAAGQTSLLAFSGLTPAADVYSLAKTMYTMLTGEAPRAFAGEQITELPEAVRDMPWAGELSRIVKRATSRDPRERHQTVGEFWTDLGGVRHLISDGEPAGAAGSEVPAPQPHVSRGYTPIAPELPRFEPVTEPPVRSRRTEATAAAAAASVPMESYARKPFGEATDAGNAQRTIAPGATTSRKRGFLHRAGVFLLVISVFTGILYGTAIYMRGRGFLPEIRNPFKAKVAVANTDIYLRPAPNADNEPIGLVTKNSKVRIVKSQNNWYQVDVVEQGRARPEQATATRGWLNGRYLEISDN